MLISLKHGPMWSRLISLDNRVIQVNPPDLQYSSVHILSSIWPIVYFTMAHWLLIYLVCFYDWYLMDLPYRFTCRCGCLAFSHFNYCAHISLFDILGLPWILKLFYSVHIHPPSSAIMVKTHNKTNKTSTSLIKSLQSSLMKGAKKISAAVIWPLKWVQTSLMSLSSKVTSIAESIHSSSSISGGSGM